MSYFILMNPKKVGAVATTTKATTTTTMAAANAATAGLAAPVMSTVEDFTSVGLTFIAILIPALVLIVLIALIWAAVWLLRRRRRRVPALPGDG